MSLNARTTFIGLSGSLAEFEYSKSYRSNPDVRVSYKDVNDVKQVVNICAGGARTLAKALKHYADLADPPAKR